MKALSLCLLIGLSSPAVAALCHEIGLNAVVAGLAQVAYILAGVAYIVKKERER